MGIQYAGEYNLDVCTLITSKGISINLLHTIVQIDIFEEIFKTGITGSIVVADTNGIIQEGQVLGQDYLRLKVSTPSLENDNAKSSIDYVDDTFIIYRIGTKFDVSKNAEVFELSFMTPEALMNTRTRISRSFTNTNSEIVEQILLSPNIIDSRKKLFIEPSIGIRKYIVPNKRPYDFINQLCNDSISQTNGSPHYVFFENTKGIHFQTLQSLYKEPVIGEFHDGDVGSLQNEGSTKVRDIEQEYKRALLYEPNPTNDMLFNIMSGLMGSTNIEYNLFHKKYTLTTYGYFDNFKDYDRINGRDRNLDNPIYNDGSIDDFGHNVGDFKNARIFLHPINVNDDNLGDANYYNSTTSTYSYSPNRKAKTVSQRQSKVFELNSTISATLKVNGHTNLAAGQCINMSRPSSKGGLDEEFSGKFMITKLRHTFSQSTRKHEVSMMIAKDSSIGAENGPIKQPRGSKKPVQYYKDY